MPTTAPTEIPTADPSHSPSEVPTAEPTFPWPTVAPTIRPTAVPTLTRSPSARPTKQTSPVVGFQANITMNNVAQPYLDEDGKRVVAVTTASVMNLPSGAVTVTAIADVPSRRLTRRQLEGSYSFVAVLWVAVALDQTAYPSTTVLYANTTAQLSNAVNVGVYEATLDANAVTYGTPDLFHVSTSSVVYTPEVVTVPPEDTDTDSTDSSSHKLTGGGAAGVVLFILFFAALGLYLAYQDIRNSGSGARAVQKGYSLPTSATSNPVHHSEQDDESRL